MTGSYQLTRPGQWAFSLLLLLALPLQAEIRAWSFVQQSGGLRIGQPYRQFTSWYLPIRANVSGIEAISTQPSQLNSGLTCKEVMTDIDKQAIYLAIATEVGKGDARCPPAKLRDIAPGRYRVYYQYDESRPKPLGDITITSSTNWFTALFDE
jgi:hypothetical protein